MGLSVHQYITKEAGGGVREAPPESCEDKRGVSDVPGFRITPAFTGHLRRVWNLPKVQGNQKSKAFFHNHIRPVND